MLIEPRPYQKQAIEDTLSCLMGGKPRVIIQLPTGAGKTIVGQLLAKYLCEHEGMRGLWLAHTDELIQQPIKALETTWPGARKGIVKAESDDRFADDIVIASVQTLSRQSRLDRNYGQGFGYIIVDEAHHAASTSYKRILKRFAPKYTIGLTATPFRSDGKSLLKSFDAVSYAMSIVEAVDQGWLSPYIVERIVLTDLDISKIPRKRGKIDERAASDEMLQAGAAEAVAEKMTPYIRDEGRKPIVFTCTVDQAKRTSAEFEKLGVKSHWISGAPYMKSKRRRELLKKHKDREIEVLVNSQLLTEGYDDPSVDCIGVAKVILSQSTYVQVVGRGLRKHPGKKDCRILDFTGAKALGVVVAADLFGKGENGGSATSRGMVYGTLKDQETELARVRAFLDAATRDGNPVSTKVNFDIRHFAWIECGPGLYALPCGNAGNLVMVEEPDGWIVELAPHDRKAPLQPVYKKHTTIEIAQGIAETRVRQMGYAKLAAKNALWRGLPLNESLSRALRKWRITVKSWLFTTQGEASDLITRTKIKGRYKKRRMWQ